MKIKLCLAICSCAAVLALSAAVFGDALTDEYSPLMKPAAAANVALQKAVMDGDMATAAAKAAEVQANFAKVEAFWTKSGTQDAIGFAKGAQATAKDVQTAAAAGDKAAATAAAQKIGANCAGCHMAHRTRLPDGTFQLKP